VEVTLKPPQVPYRETIAAAAAARARHKKQTGGRGQFGECAIEIEPILDPAHPDGFEFVDRIKGGVIPSQFIPAVEKGVREAMQSGPVAGYPVGGVRVTVVDGSFHPVDSSELAFKLAGAQAMRDALAAAQPVLLEPIMLVTVSVPEEHVGEVMGDLNSRRGRPQGMEPAGSSTEIRAEVPMAEMLSYAPDLRSITQGQGDYTLELLRYESLPTQLVARVLEKAGVEPAPAHA
jgi:elongation factor G